MARKPCHVGDADRKKPASCWFFSRTSGLAMGRTPALTWAERLWRPLWLPLSPPTHRLWLQLGPLSCLLWRWPFSQLWHRLSKRPWHLWLLFWRWPLPQQGQPQLQRAPQQGLGRMRQQQRNRRRGWRAACSFEKSLVQVASPTPCWTCNFNAAAQGSDDPCSTAVVTPCVCLRSLTSHPQEFRNRRSTDQDDGAPTTTVTMRSGCKTRAMARRTSPRLTRSTCWVQVSR